jgi:hypothetical protein
MNAFNQSTQQPALYSGAFRTQKTGTFYLFNFQIWETDICIETLLLDRGRSELVIHILAAKRHPMTGCRAVKAN